ncbi:MAG: M20/M25/M40 family metallo-hydrolase [candidate division KSB1 bacterium]|nr:M20/M25/M40 family metallo-hydrolase [candidate division KSB1 bacterium]
MRNRLLFLVATISLSVIGSKKNSPPPREALDAIRPSDIRQHIEFLASDSLKGRDTPSPELDRAAQYIADEFKRHGIKPVKESYFHAFHVSKVRLGDENRLALTKRGQEQAFAIKKDFMPFDMTASASVTAPLVFAGYGITAPEYGYDDYAGLEANGKIVLVMRHEPGEKDPASPFDGERATEYSQVSWKVQNAIDRGAVGLLVIQDPLNHRSLAPRGFPWPSLYEGIPDEALPLTLTLTEKEKIPVVQIGETVVEHLLGSVDTLRHWQQQIDRTFTPKPVVLADIAVTVQTTTDATLLPTRNVVGLVEGSDVKLKSELVVIGAHYDHVGYLKQHRPGQDYIYNGADDNASGTSAVLAIAKAFGAAKQKPKRSVLLMAFAGEEKGLYGSRAYVESPLFPLENTVAMLNLDMVGRNAPDSVSVGGVSRSPDLIHINEQENREVGLTLDYSVEGYHNRSDHYNFARKKIPFLFYFTGLHEDYHQVSDHADKINEEKIARIATLAFRVAWRAANTEQRFRYLEPKN